MLTWLDRAIGYISPTAGARRARARLMMQGVRSYEGAKLGRRTDGWVARATSANAEIGPALTRLRDRSRDLCRNNPYAARAVEILTANAVGTGILPRSVTGDDALDQRVEDLWARWADAADADGQMDVYGIQRLAVQSALESGESLLRFRPRDPGDMLPVPLQVQALESDFIDSTKDGIKSAQGNDLVQGIELDFLGRRHAYWLFNRHPGDATAAPLASRAVLARNIVHLYEKRRPGQVRGVPRLAPVMLRLRDLDDYHEAALVRAKIEACLAAFVTRPDNGALDPLAPESASQDGEEHRIETFEPGMIEYLSPGESVEFANPSSSGGFDAFSLATLMAIASGFGITYDQLTGDLRQANYSSLRAGKIEFRRVVEQLQYQTIIPAMCRPMWARFIEAATSSGALPRRGEGYPVEWVPPAHEPIDPLKDTRADIERVQAGAMTWPEFVTRWGYDPRRQLAEIARWNGLMDAVGVVVTTDPRKTLPTQQQAPEGE